MAHLHMMHHKAPVYQISCKSDAFLHFGGHLGFKMAAITIQNGCHMVRLFNLYNPTNFQKDWSNNEFLWIFYDFFHFLSGGHFEMAAILKILKLNCTSPHSELFLCQVSLRCVKFPKICNFRFFHISVTMATAQANFEFSCTMKLL